MQSSEEVLQAPLAEVLELEVRYCRLEERTAELQAQAQVLTATQVEADAMDNDRLTGVDTLLGEPLLATMRSIKEQLQDAIRLLEKLLEQPDSLGDDGAEMVRLKCKMTERRMAVEKMIEEIEQRRAQMKEWRKRGVETAAVGDTPAQKGQNRGERDVIATVDTARTMNTGHELEIDCQDVSNLTIGNEIEEPEQQHAKTNQPRADCEGDGHKFANGRLIIRQEGKSEPATSEHKPQYEAKKLTDEINENECDAVSGDRDVNDDAGIDKIEAGSLNAGTLTKNVNAIKPYPSNKAAITDVLGDTSNSKGDTERDGEQRVKKDRQTRGD